MFKDEMKVALQNGNEPPFFVLKSQLLNDQKLLAGDKVFYVEDCQIKCGAYVGSFGSARNRSKKFQLSQSSDLSQVSQESVLSLGENDAAYDLRRKLIQVTDD